MALSSLYGAMQAVENQLGGGEGVRGIYGSVTRASMDRVVAAMKAHAGFTADSVLVDVGSGLGRPLAHAAVDPGVRRGVGIEIDRVKHDKALEFMRRVSGRVGVPFDVQLVCEHVGDHEPARDLTHAYAFWEGFSTDDKRAVARLVRGAPRLRHVVVVQRAMRDPEAAMRELGFGLVKLLRDPVRVTMSGSGRAFRAYLFELV